MSTLWRHPWHPGVTKNRTARGARGVCHETPHRANRNTAPTPHRTHRTSHRVVERGVQWATTSTVVSHE